MRNEVLIKEAEDAVASPPGLPRLADDRRALADSACRFVTWLLARARFRAVVRALGWDEARSSADAALVNAARMWDRSAGKRFTTYAAVAIFHQVWRDADVKLKFDQEAVPFAHLPDPGNLRYRRPRGSSGEFDFAGVRDAVDVRELRSHLAKVSPAYREVIELRLTGLKFNEIDLVRGSRRGSSQMLYKVGIDRLRRHFYAEKGEACRAARGLPRFAGNPPRKDVRARVRVGVAKGA